VCIQTMVMNCCCCYYVWILLACFVTITASLTKGNFSGLLEQVQAEHVPAVLLAASKYWSDYWSDVCLTQKQHCQLMAIICLVCVEQATSDDVLYAEAGADRFIVVVSSIAVSLAGVQAAAWPDLWLSVWHWLCHGMFTCVCRCALL